MLLLGWERNNKQRLDHHGGYTHAKDHQWQMLRFNCRSCFLICWIVLPLWWSYHPPGLRRPVDEKRQESGQCTKQRCSVYTLNTMSKSVQHKYTSNDGTVNKGWINNGLQTVICTFQLRPQCYISAQKVKWHIENTSSPMHHIISVIQCRRLETDGQKWNEWLKERLQYI